MAEAVQETPTLRRVLDAGCGRWRPVDFDGAYVVGLDISADQLAANPGLDERIVGDLETYPLAPGSFDEILCFDVLEHLACPERALANMAQALRPGGVLTIGVPNLLSLKGQVTKWTPYRFHCWWYRRVQHVEATPFPTYLRWSMRPAALRRAGRRSGLGVETSRFTNGLIRWLTWRSEYLLVLRRPN